MKMHEAIWLAGVAVILTSFVWSFQLHPHIAVGIGLLISGTIHWLYHREGGR